jgi:hypothetical protein
MRILFFVAALICTGLIGCSNDQNQQTDGGFIPHEPPAHDNPYVDQPFIQEFNHTINEVEPGIGELIAVLLPPSGSSDLETPIQLTPRGLVTHSDTGELLIDTIEQAQPDLKYATLNSLGLVAASPTALHFYDPSLGWTVVLAPQQLTISGLASSEDTLYVLTDQGIGWAQATDNIFWPDGQTPTTAAVFSNGVLYSGGEGYVTAQTANGDGSLQESLWTLNADNGLSVGQVAGLVTDITIPAALDLVVVGQDGLQAFDLSNNPPTPITVEIFAPGRVPLATPVTATKMWDGGFIVATRGGAYRSIDHDIGPEWRVYQQRRWLPSEDVRAVAVGGQNMNPIYFATAAGLASVTFQEWTLEDKMDMYTDYNVTYCDREGSMGGAHLMVPGDLESAIPWDSDNDGGWTCYWLLAECFRYKVTGAQDAKDNFDRSLERMLSFQTLTGTDYFLARTVIRKEGCQMDDCDNPDGGEWFTSPDGEWWVKADTSNDEVTSHMFMMGHAYDLCADAEQKQAIVQHVDRIIGGIIDHGYQLWDIDGETTTYGQLHPGYVNNPLSGAYADGGRRSVQLIGAINLAYYLTGKQKYVDAKQDLIENHHYDENIIHESETPFRSGHYANDGDELATQGFYPLLRYETDPVLREKWLDGWRRSYSNMRLQQAAWWDITNAIFGGEDPDFFFSGRWFKRAPVDFLRWNMHGLHRTDLIDPPEFYIDENCHMRSDGHILPYDERRIDHYNATQYKGIDGSYGWGYALSAADVLAPYWMGRYYGFIVPAE